jgi:TolB-like protein
MHRSGGRSDGSCPRNQIRSLGVSTRAISAELERSIAVLPFENLSANGEDTYFTQGMQDEITGDLARWPV